MQATKFRVEGDTVRAYTSRQELSLPSNCVEASNMVWCVFYPQIQGSQEWAGNTLLFQGQRWVGERPVNAGKVNPGAKLRGTRESLEERVAQ